MSETLPAASMLRNMMLPLSSMTTGAVYSVQGRPLIEYSFVSLSALKVAVTVTSPLVRSVTSATALGASGAVLSIFVTS